MRNYVAHQIGTVVFMGLDGTGKTTQAEALERDGAARGRRPVRVHHASTKVPGLRELKQRYHSAAVRILRRHRSRPTQKGGKARTLTGTGAVAWSLSIYLLVGSFIKSFWYQWKYRKEVLILDRYFLDDVVKVRWRFGIQTRLSGFLMRIVPAPDVVVVLEGDPAVTFERKKAPNCTYEEYLEKGRVLERTLCEAVEMGWTVERVGIDGRSPAGVFQQVSQILETYPTAQGGQGPKHVSGAGDC